MLAASDANKEQQSYSTATALLDEVYEMATAGPSRKPTHDAHDYTEGALAMDIDDIVARNRRTRRDSQYSSLYGDDGEGAMFDGPGHTVNPSSVSRMSYKDNARRSSEFERSRRRSYESVGSHARGWAGRRASNESRQSLDIDPNDGDDSLGGPGKPSKHPRSPSPVQSTPTVLENIAHLFGRTASTNEIRSHRRSSSGQSTVSSTRRSLSRQSSDAASDHALETDEEDWGYTSGEEAGSDTEPVEDDNSAIQSMEYDSGPPSPNASFPLLTHDPIFGGGARIDMGISFDDLDPPPPGPPSRQAIYIIDEDTTIRIIGYECMQPRQYLWRIGYFLSFGILALLGHWFPRLWLRCVASEKAFIDMKNGFVVVETPQSGAALLPVRTIRYPYHISTVFGNMNASDPSLFKPNGTAGENSEKLDNLRVVDYRYSRFALDPRTGLFVAVSTWRDPTWSGLQAVQNGLEESARQQRVTLFGNNEINIEEKSVLSLLVEEIIHPFYVFQIVSIILWSLDDYFYYAFCIALISFMTITSTLIDTKKTISQMRKMSRYSCMVNVYVDGRWIEMDSAALVPGDIINLTESQVNFFPCDMFLLSGDAIINESMLTGESVPVSKFPIKSEDLARWKDSKDVNGEMAKSFLFSGTQAIRIRGALSFEGGPGQPALALVVRIGFNTTKGALVRSMLFPKPIGFKFYRDSMRFICVLAGLAGLGFCASAIQFIRLGLSWHTILIRALDLITVVVPPALPATLSIGTSFAIGRLRKSRIFCISPSRVNIAGKVNVCCFDKTGTLTEDGLDILGIRGLYREGHRFGELIDNVHDLPSTGSKDKANFLHALATCHSLKMLDGVPIGDPLDTKMFEFTRWTLEESYAAGTGVIKGRSRAERPTALVQTVVRPPGSAQFRLEDALKGGAKRAHFLELGVIRTFEFVSALRRMSVIVKRLKSTSMEIYVKGAPEVMNDICLKDSFPHDYDDLLSYYTKRGYRVIAIAGKSVEGLSWLKAQRLKREQAESGLRFLGLVIFENRLKQGTAFTIQTLRSAHFACRMITGDNPLTAVSVARECNLINQAAYVFSPSFIRGNAATPSAQLEWSCMDEISWKLDGHTLRPLSPPPHSTVAADEIDYQDYALVVTGDVFRWMLDHAPFETLQRMLVKAQIFARMSPDEKNEIVERLQSLGYTVLMCGDGANDCAALKAADVGISLSEAEASVAAPFTSGTPDISCVVDVIKEGRAALVTSFSCFKYMALYSLIQFTTITYLYSFASSLGDFQFLYIDLFIIIPIAVSMGRTLPFPRIHPKRPTASLVSRKVLASIIGQVIITSAVQSWAFFWVRRQEWYIPPRKPDTNPAGDKLDATNFENSVLFLTSCFQYILVAGVFSIGPPYRKSMWTNGWLMLSMVTLSLFNVMVLVAPPQPIVVVLELMTLPGSGRRTLLALATINLVLSMVYEQWGSGIVARLAGWALRWRRRVRDGKAYYKAVDVR